MFYVYVLRSNKNKRRYIGYTSLLPLERLKQHNNGSNKFTKQLRPFTLIYSEEFANKAEALKREKFLKSGQGRKFLDHHTPA